METITTFLHGVSVGLLLLTAAALARPGAGAGVRLWGAVFAFSVTGYVVWQDPALVAALRPFGDLAWALSTTSSGCFLLFARALLRDPPATGPDWPGLAVLATFATLSLSGALSPHDVSPHFWMAHQTLEFAVYGYAVWLAVGGWRNDLVEDRRAIRGPLVAVITVYGLLQGVFETISFFAPRPASYPVWEALALAAVSLGVPLFILQTRWDRLARTPAAAAPGTDVPAAGVEVETSLSVADRLELKRVLDLVDGAGAFREEGLTIGVLAERVQVPEHRLRRLINQGLGYRNYSAFLNDRRIAAAKAALSDPAQARTPVLTLALDLGYGSVGPFNRAFKEATGLTPSAFRAANLSPDPK